MKLVPYDVNKIYEKRSYTNLYKLLDEFVKSDCAAMKLEGYTHCSARSCQSSLFKAIKTFGFNSVMVVVRKDEVFLVKKH